MSLFNTGTSNGASKVCHVYPYTPTLEAQNITGYRNVVIRWKSRTLEDGTKVPAHTPVLVSVPVYEVVCADGRLQGMMQDAYDSAQDTLVRAHIEAEMAVNYNLTSYGILESALAPDMVVLHYDDMNKDGRSGGGKLSKDLIGSWFVCALENKLAAAFLEKSGTSENGLTVAQIQKLEDAVGRYKESFMRLAAPSVKLKGNVLDQLSRALSICEDGDVMVTRLAGVITKARNVKDEYELDAL